MHIKNKVIWAIVGDRFSPIPGMHDKVGSSYIFGAPHISDVMGN